MKKLVLLLFVLLSSYYVEAQCTLSNGASVSTIQNAENSAASGSCGGSGNNAFGVANNRTVNWAAGNYSITSVINIGNGTCNIGPTISPWTTSSQPTAKLTGGPIGGAQGFSYGSGSAAGCFAYLSWNGNLAGNTNEDGGGWIDIGANTSNLTIEYNQAYGINGTVANGDTPDLIIYAEGYAGSSSGSPDSLDQNITIEWNHFGVQGSNDCGPIMQLTSYQGSTFDSAGGYCGAFGTYGDQTNLTFAYNIVTQMEQGLKFFEPGCASNFGSCFAWNAYLLTNVNVYNNDISYIHRIGLEGQQQPYGTGVNIYNNSFHDGYYTSFGSWQFSLAMCCSPNGLQGPLNFTGNVLIGANSTSGNDGGPGLEFWSIGSANNNLEQGYAPLQYGCGEDPWAMNYNVTAVYGSTSGGINDEGCPPTSAIPLASQVGNVDQGWPPVSLISTAPSISPSSGSFSGAHNVTFTDAGNTSGVGPQGNHSIWYTVDGSTPTPGSGTAVCIASGGIASIVATTVKAVGMWGSCNQPASYAAGYGFTPSGSVTATYSSGGSTPTAAPTYNPGTENFTNSISPIVTSSTSGAVISCTANGNALANANSPATLGPFTATTVLVCTATAPGFTTSSSSTATYTLSTTQPTAGTPTYNPGTSTFNTSISPVVTSSTSGATINCTANGTTLATHVTPYTTGPFTANTTLVCYATASGYTQSGSSTATYTLNSSTPTAAAPTYNPGSETFTTSVSPIVSSSTPNSTINCVVNGATQAGAASPATFGPYTASTTMVCTASAAGFNTSASSTAAYTLQSSGPPPGSTIITPSMSIAQIQTAISGTSSGGTVAFQAGTYATGTTTLGIPCGVTVTGPVVSPVFTNYNNLGSGFPVAATPTQPTAILVGTPNVNANSIFYVSGCSTGNATTTVQYLWGQNIGLLSIAANTNNIAVLNNWCTNIVPTGLSNGGQEDCVDIAGYGGSETQNVLIQYNQFGDANSCADIFADTSYDNGNNPDQGGYCSGVQASADRTTNLVIENNFFYHLEEHVHINQNFSGNPVAGDDITTCDECSIRFNFSFEWQRINYEIQPSVDTGATGIYVSDNVVSYPPNALGSSFGISMACCVSNATYSGIGADPADYVNDNLIINNAPNIPPFGIEWWGVGAQGNNNLIEGAWDNYFTVGTGNFGGNYGSPQWVTAGNYMCGGNTTFGFNLYNNEEDSASSQANTPTNLTFEGAGNVFGYTAAAATYAQNCAQQVSGAPTISPNGGNYTGSQVVTIGNAAFNTTSYYTIDGSTPVPGQGTTQIYNGPFTITGNNTVQAVGMWGQAPQPISYPAPYGWIPSGVVTANFTNTGGGGGGGVAAPVFTPGSENFTGSVSPVVTTTTVGASINCTVNGAPITGSLSPKTLGPFTVTTTVSCNASLNGVQSASTQATYSQNGSLTLTSITTGLNGSSSLNIGGTVQGTATCFFSNGTSAACNATYPVTWTSTNTTVASVSSTGLVTGLATGLGGIFATAGGVVGSTATLTVGQTAPAPTMSPAPPYTFSTTVQVTLSDTLSGAAIYYCTTVGCSPNQTSTPYTGAITLSSTTTITAIAVATGYSNSPLTTGTYTLGGSSPTLASVATSLAGGASTVALNGTVQAIATCTLTNGTSSPCAAPYAVSSWNTSNPAIATVSSTGVVSGVATGTASIWAVAGGITGSSVSVTVVTVTLTGLNIATTGGLASFNVGATNQILATCVYSNGTFDSCNTPDSSGNSVTGWTSINNSIISINGSGLITALSPGTSSIGAYIGGSTSTTSQLGVTNEDLGNAQVTYTGSINTQYMVTGSAAGGYTVNSCSFYLPTGTQTSGAFWDCVLNQATSSTTQSAAALCSARYTTSGTSTPAGWVTVNMTGCPTLAANQGYWLGLTTNQAGPVGQGGYDCGSSCTGSAPTSGVGSYGYFFYSATFGSYTSLATSFIGQTTSQSSQYLTVSNTGSAVINSNSLNLTVLGLNGVTTLQGIKIQGVQVP